MLKFEVKILETWHEIKPSFEEVKIVAKLQDKNPLQKRLFFEGELIIHNALGDYNLLLPYANSYNEIVTRITDITYGEVYNAYLIIQNKHDFSKKQLTADIIIIDEYYNFYNNSEKDWESDIDLKQTDLQQYRFYTTNLIGTPYLLLRMYNFENVIKLLVNEIDSTLSFDMPFFTGNYQNWFIYGKEDSKAGYIDTWVKYGAVLKMQNYADYSVYTEDELTELVEELKPQPFNINLKEILDQLAEIFQIYWYIEDGVFNLKKYKEFSYTNGLDISSQIFNSEKTKVLEYEFEKPAIIKYNNNDESGRQL